ncbi:MAG: phosphatase PAP2 family protein [Acidobacteria bacterium]|nr:phosphatase PAP2 family protein [Acidobacteriota bacterium]
MHAPLIFEALSTAFFVVMAAAAFLTRAPHHRRRRVALLSVGGAAAVVAASYMLPADVRLWLGHVYLVAGYRLPALLVPVGPAEAGRHVRGTDPGSRLPDPEPFEAWLIRTDERWFRFRPAIPAWAAHVLELSYLFCYLLVPAAFVFIWMAASAGAADRFWAAVLLAGFACYGLLPWLVSRPPRIRYVAPVASAAGIRRLNLYILGRASHGFNTFPSGHVAVSVAAALEVFSVSTSAGLAALIVALAIAAGAVAGRYHYVIDVVVGGAVGAAAWLLT